MPKVTVKKSSSLPATDAFNKVSDILKNDEQLKKLDSAYACEFQPEKLSGTASGKMFKAKMKIESNGTGSEIEIIVELPLALTLAKGLVQTTLEKKLAKVLS